MPATFVFSVKMAVPFVSRWKLQLGTVVVSDIRSVCVQTSRVLELSNLLKQHAGIHVTKLQDRVSEAQM